MSEPKPIYTTAVGEPADDQAKELNTPTANNTRDWVNAHKPDDPAGSQPSEVAAWADAWTGAMQQTAVPVILSNSGLPPISQEKLGRQSWPSPEHLQQAIDVHRDVTGERPLGWYLGRCGPNSHRLVAEEGGFLYNADTYADDLPYWDRSFDPPQLMVPYTLDANDMRFATPQGFNSGQQFLDYLKDSFDVLYDEGETKPKMMSVGLHCRLAGRPGRAAALQKFLDYVATKDDVWIARCLIELEQWIQAENVLLGRLRREPEDTVTLELLAYVYNQQGNWPGVIGIYRELLKIAPQRTAYRIALAKALTVNEQRQEAIDMLEFARHVDISLSEEIDRLLADLYLAEEMPQEAAGCYTRLIRKMDSPSAEDYCRLGLAYFRTGDLVSAEDAFGHMRQRNPADFKADLYLGHVAGQAGRVVEAQAHYLAALENDSTSVESLVALADLQIKTKHEADAAVNLGRAITLGDNRPQVHYNYILALMAGNDETSVRAALKSALAEHPSDDQIRRLLEQYITQIAYE